MVYVKETMHYRGYVKAAKLRRSEAEEDRKDYVLAKERKQMRAAASSPKSMAMAEKRKRVFAESRKRYEERAAPASPENDNGGGGGYEDDEVEAPQKKQRKSIKVKPSSASGILKRRSRQIRASKKGISSACSNAGAMLRECSKKK